MEERAGRTLDDSSRQKVGHSACCTITGSSPVPAGQGATLHHKSVLREGIVIPAFDVEPRGHVVRVS